MNLGMFYGIGLGPGDPGLVTLKALELLRRTGKIYAAEARNSERSVAETVVRSLPGVTAEVVPLTFTMSRDWTERLETVARNARLVADELERGIDCAFVTIGDCMTYSTCSYLLRALEKELPGLRSELVPGVNSWSALAAKIKRPLAEDREILRIVPRFDDRETAFPENSTTILLKTYRSKNDLLKRIPDDAEIHFGANLGLDREVLAEGKAAVGALPDAYLSMIAVKRGERHD